MRKKQIVLFLLATTLSLSLLPACGGGGNGDQTSDTSDTVTTDETTVETTGTLVTPETTETEPPYGELAFDEVCADIYEVAGNAWGDVGNRGKRAFAATSREEFLALYNETWTNGVDVFANDNLLQKARDYFTDDFFTKNTVIVLFPQNGHDLFYTTVESVMSGAGTLTIACRYIICGRFGSEPVYFRSNIVIIDKADYDGEEIKVTHVSPFLGDNEPFERALLEGWAFENQALYLNALSQKRADGLATLEKYRP